MPREVFPRFSIQEYERRQRLVRQVMREQDVEAPLIYSSSMWLGAAHYLSNYLSWMPTNLIYPLEGEPTLILHFHNHIPTTKKMAVVEDVQWHRNDPVGCLLENINRKRLSKAKLGLVGLGTMPHLHYARLR